MSGIGEALIISAAVSLATAGLTYALTPTQKIEGNRQDDLTTGIVGYGSPLPWCWGTVRVPGKRIFSGYKEEKSTKKKQGKGAKVETEEFSYYGYYATAFAECKFRPVQSINRGWMNKDLIFSPGYQGKKEYLTFYLGEQNQPIDPLLENIESISSYNYGIPTVRNARNAYLRSFGIDPATVPNSPAYNQLLYYVATRLPLEDYYDQLPNTEELEIVASSNCTVGQIYQDIFGLVYPEYDFDYSLISTDEFAVDGYTIDSIQAAKNTISNLQKSHFIEIILTGNGFKFIPLNSPRNVINLRKEDLAAYQSGTKKPLDFERIDPDPTTLPTKVIVSYIDANLNYDRNIQDSVLIVKDNDNSNVLNLSFTEVMSASKAATIADRSLLFAWILGSKYKFSLSPSYLDTEPCDVVANVFDDRGYPIKITQNRIGADFRLQCEGVLHDLTPMLLKRNLLSGNLKSGIADYAATISLPTGFTGLTDADGNAYTEGTDYTVNNGEITINPNGNISDGSVIGILNQDQPTQSADEYGLIKTPGDTELLVLDIPLLSDEHADYSLYLAAGGGQDWTGCSVYVSTDKSRYFYTINFATYSIYGVTVNVDSENKITVEVNEPELASVTNNDLALGFNVALIGNQIVQFKNSVLTDINTYELSEITFGLRGTETQPLPVIGDRFVLLQGENAEIQRIAGSSDDIGQMRYFKALSAGQTLDQVQPVQLLIEGIAQRPYAPVNLSATKNGVGDINITWSRRDRHGLPNLSEASEAYELNIIGQNGTIRTTTISTNSYIYLATDQISDFGSIQTEIAISVAQISTEFGAGSLASATLIPIFVEPVPIISSFNPASAQIGSTINIVGNNLAGVTAAKIGDINQTNLAVTDNQNLSFVLTNGSVSGNIDLSAPGGNAISPNALIVEAVPPSQKPNYPSPNPVNLPYTLLPADDGSEIIVNGETGSIIIPNDVTDPNGTSYFEPTWGCHITLENPGQITTQKADGTTTEIKGNNVLTVDNQTVRLWHRGNNVWKID